MLRRSHHPRLFYSLPYKNQIIYVNLSQLYTAWKADYIQFVFETRLFPEKKAVIHDTVKDDYVLELYRKDPHNIVNLSGLSEFQSERYLDASLFAKARLIYKPFFRNKRSHIKGRINAIYHADYIPIRQPAAATEYYLTLMDVRNHLDTKVENGVTYLQPTTANEYVRIKAAAMRLYFPMQPSEWILIHNVQSQQYCFHRPTDIEMNTVRTLVRHTRHAIQSADAFFEFDAFHTRLLPNMKHDSKVWEQEKIRFADRVGEISRLWGCTVRHRYRVLRYGFQSWKDCTGEILGFMGKKREIVDAIIRVNKGESWMHIHNPSVLDLLRNKELIFVDFEWTEHVYLIGLYDGREYTALWADSLKVEDIIAIFRRFASIVQDKTIVYWYAEKTRWQSDVKRLGIEDLIPPLHWIDLYAVFRDGITVKGAFDFKLKHMAEAFYKHDKLPYFINDFDCQNGADSIVLAKEYYKHKDITIRQSIEKYNRFDCESMFCMLQQIYFFFNKDVEQRRSDPTTDTKQDT